MSSIKLYVSATTSDYHPGMGETLAHIGRTLTMWLEVDYLAIEPVIGYWEGEKEYSAIVTLCDYESPARALEIARGLAVCLGQDAVMAVSPRPAKGYSGVLRVNASASHFLSATTTSGFTKSIASDQAHTFVAHRGNPSDYVAFVSAH